MYISIQSPRVSMRVFKSGEPCNCIAFGFKKGMTPFCKWLYELLWINVLMINFSNLIIKKNAIFYISLIFVHGYGLFWKIDILPL